MYIVAMLLALLLASVVAYIFVGGPKLPPGTDAVIEDVVRGDVLELVVGHTGYASSEGLDIWYESIPPEGATKGTVLLIMANGGDALFWPRSFVRTFLGAGYRVVRYDHRGTGMSDWVKDWDRRNPYTIADMSGDAIAVMDAAGVGQAHVVGLSLGGMIAQELAIHHPDRVASLSLLMTSGHIGDPEVPGLTSTFFWRSLWQGLPLMKYRLLGGEKNLIKERIAKTIVVVGCEGLDVRELAEAVVYDLRNRRGINVRGAWQHFIAVQNSGSRYEGLKRVHQPTLVVHGTNDGFIPNEHGQKLVEVMPNAEGMWLHGVGHVFPVPDMDALSARIIAHLNVAG